METVVQSYMLKENESLVFDTDEQEKWKAQVEEMGLEGQQKLVQSSDSPVPFLWMNSRMKGMFDLLCPKKEALTAYSKTPIPLEALGLIGLAQRENYFKEIFIRYDEVDPDPVAIGETTENEQYLIARWGAEDKSLDRLETEARVKCKEDTERQLKSKMHECQDRLSRVDAVVEERMNGRYFYV